MIYNDGSTSTLYYYVLNAQGDVIALLNADGTLAASYNYGAWGNYSVHDADGNLLDISINLEINMQMDYTLKPLPPISIEG